MNIRKLFLALTATTAMLAADLSGPVLGYARVGATLRPILGIPGASYFGTPIETGEFALTAVSSAGGYAVAFKPGLHRVDVVPFDTRQAQKPFMLLDHAATIHSVVLSGNGTSLAVVRDDNQIDIFTGLPSTPRKHRTLSLPATPSLAAVSDDGEAVAVADRSTLLTLFKRQEAREIGAVDLRHIAFRPGSHDFAYIDGDLVITVDGTTSRVVAGALDGVSGARSVIASPDGRSVFIFNAGGKELLVTRDGTSQRFDLPCEAADLEWLGDSTLRSSCVSGGRVHLIDVSERGPRILFIPEPVE